MVSDSHSDNHGSDESTYSSVNSHNNVDAHDENDTHSNSHDEHLLHQITEQTMVRTLCCSTVFYDACHWEL